MLYFRNGNNIDVTANFLFNRYVHIA